MEEPRTDDKAPSGKTASGSEGMEKELKSMEDFQHNKAVGETVGKTRGESARTSGHFHYL